MLIATVAVLLSIWLSGKPTLEVRNVDGQAVDVVPWAGAPSITVSCGQTTEINTSGASTQPWLVTVTASADHHLLLQQQASGPLELIVRGSGVLIGAQAPSVGSAGLVRTPIPFAAQLLFMTWRGAEEHGMRATHRRRCAAGAPSSCSCSMNSSAGRTIPNSVPHTRR